LINIIKNQLSFIVKCDSKGSLIDAPRFNIKGFLDKHLREYDEVPRENYFDKTPQFKPYYNCYYDKENAELYIPNGFIGDFISEIELFGDKPWLTIPKPITPHDAQIHLRSHIEDKPDQIAPLKWLQETKTPIKCITLQTGKGKTYVAIKYITILKQRTLIIVPAHLQSQWVESLLKFTDLPEDKIYLIKGKETLYKLQPEVYDKAHSIFLSSIQSISSYISNRNDIYKQCLSFPELLRFLGIGNKIIDEAHLSFRQTLIADLLSSVEQNIYLSASFYRTDKKSNLIFQKVFIDKYKYAPPEYDQHVNVTEVIYHGINYIKASEYMSHRGYSEVKYEKYLYKRKTIFKYFMDSILVPVLMEKYLDIKKPGEKCLIIVKLKLFGQKVMDRLMFFHDGIIGDLKIGVYYSEHEKSYRDDLDIIISTFQSSGTGSDIPNLRTVLLVDNFKAKGQLVQNLGRLRNLKNSVPEFCYFQNNYIKAHTFYRWERLKIFKKRAKKFNTKNIY